MGPISTMPKFYRGILTWCGMNTINAYYSWATSIQRIQFYLLGLPKYKSDAPWFAYNVILLVLLCIHLYKRLCKKINLIYKDISKAMSRWKLYTLNTIEIESVWNSKITCQVAFDESPLINMH